ncbi:MAG: hypothetical protein CVU41_05440 [Chloroflexi bacterium HGW-Chloroflexi-3]|nr:MAG: hypothetical protein CVU41_05440 [Chloroflexi bacterium HGW-Chloroflexi-3]
MKPIWRPTLKAIIISLLLFSTFLITFPAAAEVFQIQETSLYEFGHVGSIHISPEGKLLVVDDENELWVINPQTGSYLDYISFGYENLADITFASGQQLWWTNNVRGFGNFDLNTDQMQDWSVDLTNFPLDLQLGTIASFQNYIWLPTWYGETYGLFQFNPISSEICLYHFTGGLYAADIAVMNDQIWILDWRDKTLDSLFAFNPIDGNLIKYALSRNIGELAFLFVDGNELWWAEDKMDGAVVRFVPGSSEMNMTVYSLPTGTHPRNLYVDQGIVWYSDIKGTVGQLDPEKAPGLSTTISGINLGNLDSDPCIVLDDWGAYSLTPEPEGIFSWQINDIEMNLIKPGLHVFNLPENSAAYGIAVSNNYAWISDAGRQKLIRFALAEEAGTYITVIKQIINDNGGTAKPDDFKLTLDGEVVTNGVAVPVNPGTYSVGETLLPGYSFVIYSGDCDINGGVTVALGESKTCTITNRFDGNDHYIYLPLVIK